MSTEIRNNPQIQSSFPPEVREMMGLNVPTPAMTKADLDNFAADLDADIHRSIHGEPVAEAPKSPNSLKKRVAAVTIGAIAAGAATVGLLHAQNDTSTIENPGPSITQQMHDRDVQLDVQNDLAKRHSEAPTTQTTEKPEEVVGS